MAAHVGRRTPLSVPEPTFKYPFDQPFNIHLADSVGTPKNKVQSVASPQFCGDRKVLENSIFPGV